VADEEKRKVGWAFRPEFIAQAKSTAKELRAGIADCTEAAMLMFFEQPESKQVEYLRRIEDAERIGEIDQLLRDAAKLRLKDRPNRGPRT
jgi:hypothetical protein